MHTTVERVATTAHSSTSVRRAIRPARPAVFVPSDPIVHRTRSATTSLLQVPSGPVADLPVYRPVGRCPPLLTPCPVRRFLSIPTVRRLCTNSPNARKEEWCSAGRARGLRKLTLADAPCFRRCLKPVSAPGSPARTSVASPHDAWPRGNSHLPTRGHGEIFLGWRAIRSSELCGSVSSEPGIVLRRGYAGHPPLSASFERRRLYHR